MVIVNNNNKTMSSIKSTTTTTRSSSSPSLSSMISLLSLTFVVLMLTSVVTWHSHHPRTIEKLHKNYRQRFLEQFDEDNGGGGGDGPTYDDDKTADQKCKEYLSNFLNGTTDNNDMCEGFYDAYKDSNCGDYTNMNPILGSSDSQSSTTTTSSVVKDDENKNNTKIDDDIFIDDFFENWKCCDSIQYFYEKNCESSSRSSEYHSVRLLGIMLVLLVCTILKAVTKRMQIHWLPDACIFVLVGTVVGLILRFVNTNLVQNRLSFDNDLFLQILLPPIIFQAALSIDKRAFRRDLFPILAFAGLGTLFSAIAIGIITHHVSKWGSSEHLPMLDSLVFGALISSIDPVATLSILSGVGVSQTDTLYTLIFGESLLNDGVAIVLFDTLKSHLGEDDALGPEAYREMAKNFFAILFGSIGIGIGGGIACTIYFYCLRGRQTAVTEVMIFFCWALIPYYVADGLGCSGIIAIMVMGFMMDYFVIGGFQSDETAWMDYMNERENNNNNTSSINPGVINNPMHQQHPPTRDHWGEIYDSLCKAFSGRGHILSRSRHHVGFVAQVMASLMDTAIFAYLGLFLFNGNEIWSLRLNMTSILSCVSSRFVMVVALSFLINVAVFFDIENVLARLCLACRRGMNLSSPDDDSITSESRPYLDKKTQLILLLAGVRGAVSFALVENVPVWDTVEQAGSKYKAELKAMTSSAIVFTLFVFGALTYITVKRGGGGGGSDPLSGGHVVGNLTHRLLSEPLDSDDENQSEMTGASVLEIEGHHQAGNRNHIHHPPMEQMGVSQPTEQYRAPEPQQQYAPIHNEWTE